jgi:TRAP-type C4-dicarboxylate transport system permease small subunit
MTDLAAPSPLPRGARPLGPALLGACRWTAIAGGAVLLAITLLTVASVVLREVTGRPIPGDFELVEIGCAVAVFAFLPYCQMIGGNVLVEFVTARAPVRVQAALDALAQLAYTLIAALLAWRLALGGADLKAYGETTMVLGVPVWWAFVPIVPATVLLALACAHTAWKSLGKTFR